MALSTLFFACQNLLAQAPDQPRDRLERRDERLEAELEISLEMPGPERLFRRESEPDVFERIRQQDRQLGGSGRVLFPERTPVSKDKYVPRSFPVHNLLIEPAYVTHGRLRFEQRDFERHGWDLGIMQSPLCLGLFWLDMITLPYDIGTRICQHYDTSAGKCLPGDPTPLYLYPPEFSMTGLVLQTGSAFGVGFFFP